MQSLTYFGHKGSITCTSLFTKADGLIIENMYFSEDLFFNEHVHGIALHFTKEPPCCGDILRHHYEAVVI